MRLLITGSSGYIGSVLCKIAKERGHMVIAADPKPAKHNYFDTLINDDIIMNSVAYEATNLYVDAVFHLGASADVTDSTRRPSLYYKNNIGATASLFDNLIQMGWKGPVIFSSTAAVYGKSKQAVSEFSALSPMNSYGKSKLMCEEYLEDLWNIHSIPSVIFRYFNVAGAYEDVGDHHDSHHVLQKLCYSAKENQPFFIFGSDLETRDGTCVRDYLHVRDVCEAHFTALEYLKKHPLMYHFNLGTNEGTSVKELVTKFEANTGKTINYKLAASRPGDPAYLVANPSKFINTTGFKYQHSDIENIIKSAWEWYRR